MIITIFEGIDCSGKTTLIESYRKSRPKDSCLTTHNGVYPSDVMAYHAYVMQIFCCVAGGWDELILDRSFISEIAYAPHMRAHPATLSLYCLMEEILLEFKTVIVYCDPGKDRVIESWKKRKNSEYIQDERTLMRVRDEYRTILKSSRLAITYYDYTTSGKLMNKMHKRINSVREDFYD